MIGLSIDDCLAERDAHSGPDQAFHAELRRRVRAHFEALAGRSGSGQDAPPTWERPLRISVPSARARAGPPRPTSKLRLSWPGSFVFLRPSRFRGRRTVDGRPPRGLAGPGHGRHRLQRHARRRPRFMLVALRPRVNRSWPGVSTCSGVAPYVWHRRHNLLHHTWPNVRGSTTTSTPGGAGSHVCDAAACEASIASSGCHLAYTTGSSRSVGSCSTTSRS